MNIKEAMRIASLEMGDSEDEIAERFRFADSHLPMSSPPPEIPLGLERAFIDNTKKTLQRIRTDSKFAKRVLTDSMQAVADRANTN